MDDSDDTIRLTLGLGFQHDHDCHPENHKKKKKKKITLAVDDHDRQQHQDNPAVSFLSLALSEPKPRSDDHDNHTTDMGGASTIIKDLNKGKTVMMMAAAAASSLTAVSSWTTNSKTKTMSDEEEEEDCNTPKKKLRLSKHQISILENTFQLHPTLNPKDKNDLATELNLRPRQVEVWFQNRRARIKMKQTEVDRESLKKCCEILREENIRLQKEVMELKLQGPAAMPPAFQFQLISSSSSGQTMCPSCEGTGRSSNTNTLNDPNNNNNINGDANANANASPTRSFFSSSTDSNNTPKTRRLCKN